MTAGADVACPSCGEPVDSRDSFCEACGTELAPAVVSAGAPGYVPACPVCSADPVGDEALSDEEAVLMRRMSR